MVTIGTDPELFLVNTMTNKIISAIGLIPGEKKNAYRPEGFPEGFGLQIDNILAEFNVPPVASNEGALFLAQINQMKDYIRNFVKAVNPDFDILCQASAVAPKEILDNPIAQLFGCDPDFNVYTEKQNPKPKGSRTTLRTTGMHIHVGYDSPTVANSVCMIKYMDAFLGIPSIVMDTDTRRRVLYGKAGCFRLTDYGFEYRTLSGFFLSSDETINFVFNQTVKAIEAFFGEYSIPDSRVMRNTINKGDVESAKSLISTFSLV